MPSLNVLLTGNAKPLEAEMLRAMTMGEAFARKMSRNVFGGNLTNPQSLAEGSALAQMMDKQAEAAKDTARYATMTSISGQAMRETNRLDQEAWLIKLAAARGMTVEALKGQQALKAAALANKEMAGASASAAAKGFNLNGILRESLVIVREIGRGNWARVPGSISLLAQYMGILKFLLNPVYIGLIAVGYAIYRLTKDTEEAVQESNNLNEELTISKGKFEQASDALKKHAQNLREVSDASREYKESLDEMSQKQDDIVAKTNERVKAMQDEFQLQQQLAKQRGQTETQSRSAEQAERVKERSVYEEEVASLNRKIVTAKKDYADKESQYEKTLASQKSSQDALENNSTISRKIDDAMKTLSTQMANREGFLKNVIANGGASVPTATEQGISLNDPAKNIAWAKDELSKLNQHVFEEFEIGGKKVSGSMDTLNNALKQNETAAKLQTAQDQKIYDTKNDQRAAVQASKTSLENLNQAQIESQRIVEEITGQIDAHAKADPQLNGGGGGRMPVTERERIGAQGSQISVSLLGVAKEHLAVSRDILTTIKRGHADKSVGGSHHD